MSTVVKCYCGASKVVEAPKGNIGELVTGSGFKHVMNMRNGLTSNFVCPECWTKVEHALGELLSVFGDDVGYIHFNSLFKKRGG